MRYHKLDNVFELIETFNRTSKIDSRLLRYLFSREAVLYNDVNEMILSLCQIVEFFDSLKNLGLCNNLSITHISRIEDSVILCLKLAGKFDGFLMLDKQVLSGTGGMLEILFKVTVEIDAKTELIRYLEISYDPWQLATQLKLEV